MSTLFFLVFALASSALQLLSVGSTMGNWFFDTPYFYSTDFTVYRTIAVSSVGVVDLAEPGLLSSLTVRILNRAKSADTLVWGPETFASEQREDESNPFVFRPAQFTLEPGIYAIVTTSTSNADSFHDESGVGAVRAARAGTPFVAVTGSTFGALADVEEVFRTTEVEPDNQVYVTATLLFDVVEPDVAPPPAESFPDCEAVACAGLPSGAHNIGGELHVCDNDNEGGGWLRVFDARNFPCEPVGWTSARNPAARDDVFGCRAAPQQFVNATFNSAPFSQMRHAGFALSVFKAPDAFDGSRVLDGVSVWVADKVAFGFAVGQANTATRRCPCDPGANLTARGLNNVAAIGPYWQCEQVRTVTTAWVALFVNTSRFCVDTSTTIAQASLRSWATPQQSFKVSIGRDQVNSDEDFTLTAGELFVRKTVGFSTAQHCPPRSSMATTMATTSTARTSTARTSTAGASASTAQVNAAPSNVATIAGAVGGSVAVLLLAAAAAFVFWSRRRRTVVAPAQTGPKSEYGSILSSLS